MHHRDRPLLERRRVVVAAATSLLSLAAALALAAPAGSAGLHRAAKSPEPVRARGSFDIRERATPIVPGRRVAGARTTLAARLGSQGVIASDPVTGTLRMVGRLDGYLTGPSRRSAPAVAMGFVRGNLAAFGLSKRDLGTFRLRQDYVDIGGTRHVSFTQAVRGVPVFQNGLRASVTRSGRLVNVTGSPVPGPRPASFRPRIGSETAIRAALRDGGARLAAPGADDSATLVLFPTGRGTRLAWRTLTWPSTQQLNLSVVDATTGEVLYRQSLTNDANGTTGTAAAWEFYPSDLVPAGGNVSNPVSFPVQDGTRLYGDNAWVYADLNDNNRADPGEEIPAASGTDWIAPVILDNTTVSQNCTPSRPCTWDKTVPFSWRANLAQNAAQVMYYLTRYRDHLAAAPYGFTAAAGSFELSGGDQVIANVMDGADTSNGLPDQSHFNNANMTTPPDGSPPLMQMYLFRSAPGLPIPSANGGDDAEVVYHEYTHGLTNRLVVFPDGTSALTTQQAGSMGEAWSDWYTEDFLNNLGLKPDSPAIGDVVMGDITFGGLLRSQPVDCPVGGPASECPGGAGTGTGGYTYGDFGNVRPFPQVHADGEIWLETLWQIRQTLGATTAETLVTRALELSPPGPSFLDMRNAILQADQVNFAGANQAQLWAIFAERGMGYFASSTGDSLKPVEDFSAPVDCSTTACGSIGGTIRNRATGRPIAGARVAIAGLNSGFGFDLAATTSRNGSFTIENVPLYTYPLLQIQGKGYEPVQVKRVDVNGNERLDRKLVRDWAALEGGARIGAFSPPDYDDFGCGPEGAFDLSLGSGWASDAVGSDEGSTYTGPRKVVVKLPKAVNVSSFAVASGGTCGDGPAAGVKRFVIQTRTANGGWITALTGTVPSNGKLTAFKPVAGSKKVRFVRFIMRSNHGDPLFMDVLEVSVRGS